MTKALEIRIARPIKELQQLMESVDSDEPDPAAVADLRNYLIKNPGTANEIATLATIATNNLLDDFETSSEALDELLKIGLEDTRRGLEGERSTPLEALLAQQVVMAWARLQLVEFRYTNVTAESMPIGQADFWERRLNVSQRRFLRACETLARVQKLNLQAVQINVANQQVISQVNN
jgi:hypothetical protein